MSNALNGTTRRRHAAIVGVGLDGHDRLNRIITGDHSLVVGGSPETHAELLETMLQFEAELERVGRPLGELNPAELAELARRIDLPELAEIAHRIEAGLVLQGRSFEELSAEELTALSAGLDS